MLKPGLCTEMEKWRKGHYLPSYHAVSRYQWRKLKICTLIPCSDSRVRCARLPFYLAILPPRFTRSGGVWRFSRALDDLPVEFLKNYSSLQQQYLRCAG